MKKTGIIVGAAIIIVAIVTAIIMNIYKPNNAAAPASSSSSSSASTASAVATITYSDSGFSPATTTVKAGDTVAIKNTSSSVMQMDSDPHPVHTDDTDLNVGTVNPGETKTFVVTNKGSFGFHNHLAPSNTAKIVIQ